MKGRVNLATTFKPLTITAFLAIMMLSSPARAMTKGLSQTVTPDCDGGFHLQRHAEAAV